MYLLSIQTNIKNNTEINIKILNDAVGKNVVERIKQMRLIENK